MSESVVQWRACASLDTPSYTFSLPNIREQQPKDFRLFLEKELIETTTLKTLQQSGHLNWWTQVQPCSSHNDNEDSVCVQLEALWPLSTSGDGNCLLHAASLGMWGFHDRLLILRKALHQLLAHGQRKHALWRRWRYQQSVHNTQIDLKLDEDEWRQEWQSLVQLASPTPRNKLRRRQQPSVSKADAANANVEETGQIEYEPGDDSATYESLEEIHVFALAHVLKRPVLVVADTVLRGAEGDALAPIPFGGIYLPLECSPAECHRSPLVLSYDSAHFSALVSMQKPSSDARDHFAGIPITTRDNDLLTLHFACDPGPDFTWWQDSADTRLVQRAKDTLGDGLALICQYMDVTALPIRRKVNGVRGRMADARPSDLGQSSTLPASPAHRVGQLITRSPLLRRYSRPGDSATVGRQPANTKLDMSGCRARSSERNPTDKAHNRLKLHTMLSSIKQKLRRDRTDSATRGPTCEHSTNKDIRCALSMSQVRDPLVLCMAGLHTQANHQYMHDMVNAYLQSARRRFDLQQSDKKNANTGTGLSSTSSVSRLNGVTESGVPQSASAQESVTTAPLDSRRERCMSRSLSNTSLSFVCMNGDCSRPAAPTTNFLCDLCFYTQKEIMASFSNSQLCRTLKAKLAEPEDSVRPQENGVHPVTQNNGVKEPELWVQGEPDTAVLSTHVHKTVNGLTTRIGLTAVTNQHGVTHYFVPSKPSLDQLINEYCRSPHCTHYSNGHSQLCTNCAK